MGIDSDDDDVAGPFSATSAVLVALYEVDGALSPVFRTTTVDRDPHDPAALVFKGLDFQPGLFVLAASFNSDGPQQGPANGTGGTGGSSTRPTASGCTLLLRVLPAEDFDHADDYYGGDGGDGDGGDSGDGAGDGDDPATLEVYGQTGSGYGDEAVAVAASEEEQEDAWRAAHTETPRASVVSSASSASGESAASGALMRGRPSSAGSDRLGSDDSEDSGGSADIYAHPIEGRPVLLVSPLSLLFRRFFSISRKPLNLFILIYLARSAFHPKLNYVSNLQDP